MKKKILSMLLCFTLIVCVIPQSSFAQSSRNTSYEERLATDLKSLGLFKGVSDTNFELNREPTRVEALVMLIRVLGKESEVSNDTWKHPFTDVPSWADNYIGYAYSKGLTMGTSSTTFGSGNASASMYLTFVLRALGYSDANGKDFSWDDPYTLSRNVGILTDNVNIHNFLRADVVLVSHASLSAYIKDSKQTLGQKLVSAGVFTQNEFDSVYNKDTSNNTPAPKNVLTAEEIYSKCAPAVFYIETMDSNDKSLASGSGFFIDDKGTAVTNYHVIEDAYSAFVQLSDTEAIYEVMGVYDYNKEEDWAILKIACTGNKYLTIDSTSNISGGQKVYAIGSPLGLQNTISEGIISNPSRLENAIKYIQTNAAISSGSSGGALIGENGEVIGITSAGYVEGQNLNLALPISYINGYSSSKLKSFIYIITGNENSKVKNYADYPGIPDFGAFNAVSPYKVEKGASGDTTFYYSWDSLKEANTYGAAIALYDEVAKDWGFTVDFFTQDDNFITELKCETASHTHYVYYDFFSSYNGIDCLEMLVFSETKKLAKGYADDPNAPDFGEYFNVKPRKSGGISVLKSYTYDLEDLYNQGVIDTFFEQYWKILESWGFTYIGNEEGLYGTINKFRNDDKGITITYSVQPDLEQVDIVLYYY